MGQSGYTATKRARKIQGRMKKACAQFLKMLYLIAYKASRKLKKLLKLFVSWRACCSSLLQCE